VADLSDVFLRLTEAAAAKNTNEELWGEKGYILVESGEHVWGELAEQIGKKAHEMGLINKEPKKESLSKDAAMEQAGFEAVSWGLNSRAKAERARKVLGWKPNAPSLQDEIPNILKSEHEVLKQK